MSAVVAALLIGLVLAGVLAVCVAAVWLVVPSISQPVERARIEREAQEASWWIHQQATQAFGRLLDAARHQDQEPEA